MKIIVKELKNTIREVIQEIGRHGESRTKKSLASRLDDPFVTRYGGGTQTDYLRSVVLYSRNRISRVLRELFRKSYLALSDSDETKALFYLNRAKFSIPSYKFPEMFQDVSQIVAELARDLGVPVPSDYE